MAIPGKSSIPTRPRLRAGVAAVLGAAALLGALSGAFAGLLVDDPYLRGVGRQALAASLLLGAVAAATASRHEPTRSPEDVVVGGLRSVTLALRLIGLAAGALVSVALIQHAQGVGLPPSLTTTEYAGAGLLAVVTGATLLMALGEPPSRPRSFGAHLLSLVALLAAAVLALLALLAYRNQSGLAGLDASEGAPATLLLASAVAGAFAMMASQGLPTARDVLVKTQADALPGGRPRSLVLPVVIAFALLVLSLLLFVLFGVGVVGVLGEVARSPAVLVTFLVLAVAVALAVLGAFRLVRTDETRQALLYRPPTDPRVVLERRVLVVSLCLAAVLVLAAAGAYSRALPLPSESWLHLATFGLLAGLGPYGFLVAREHNRIRRLEERFPDFLREMASSHKGGLTLAESLRISARSDYGPLTDEIRRMADQVAWNVPFTEALQRFSDRVQTPLIQRAVNLVLEADRSGGASTDVLLAAARDAREIKTLENERRISMGLYTIVIYITFFVFLGVAAVLYSQFVPQLIEGAAASQRAGEATRSTSSALVQESLRADQFQLFYFLAALVQALGDGIVAGLMGTGRAVLGLRHSFIMVVITYLTFAVFVQ